MLPPEPSLVREYFLRREQPPLSAGGGDYSAALARNDRLWTALCEVGWRALEGVNRFEQPETRPDAVNSPVDRYAEFSGADARAAYMRDYMRRRRKEARSKK